MNCVKKGLALCAMAVGSVALLPAASHAAIITQWSFSKSAAAPDNSPAPSTGTGTATPLGMTNNYTYTNGSTVLGTGAVAACDVTSSPGVANPAFSEDTWRIRGGVTANNAGGNGNGWNLAAPQYTQGAEFDASTAGYTGISFSFDWYCTTQGVKDLQEQYTTDGVTWNNIAGGYLVATANDFVNTNTPEETINLTGVAGVDNNPLFGIRLVSAYDTNAADAATTGGAGGTPTYAAASNGTVYNNNSGNWRFDNITFSGTAVPEPASASILALGAFGLMGRRRKA
jgi:PEP-CTERM motif-containing protein